MLLALPYLAALANLLLCFSGHLNFDGAHQLSIAAKETVSPLQVVFNFAVVLFLILF